MPTSQLPNSGLPPGPTLVLRMNRDAYADFETALNRARTVGAGAAHPAAGIPHDHDVHAVALLDSTLGIMLHECDCPECQDLYRDT